MQKTHLFGPEKKQEPLSEKDQANANQVKKSGLMKLKVGDVLFHENEKAQSLFIIQKGQIRLYRPKGKGFIELAVIRPGEVLGEMAYFSKDEKESTRSCSAQAITASEVIEISFTAFAKTMFSLNPWFKTIINTLASRLRNTNALVKELESNSVAIGYGSAIPGYQYLKAVELVKFLSLIYLVANSVGDISSEGKRVHKNILKYYILEIFNLGEAKFEEIINFLNELGLVKLVNDKDNLPSAFLFNDLATIKILMNFFHTQRTVTDDKRIKVSEKCETFLNSILEQLQNKKTEEDKTSVDLNVILADYKNRNIPVNLDDLNQAKECGLVSEPILDAEGKMTCKIDYEKLKMNFIPIKASNLLDKINFKKAKC